MKWISAGKGIRYREHPTRRYGNHPDRYYTLFYKVNGKTHTEALGWESESRERGRSMLQRAEELMAQIRQNRRTGSGPVIKKDRRELEELKQAEVKRQQSLEGAKDISLNEFFENHFKPFVERKLTPESYQTECAHYAKWMKDILGETSIRDINLMSWDKLLDRLHKSELSERTKIYICGTLQRVLKHARARGFQVEIPMMKQLSLQKYENRRLRVITQEELKDIFDGIEKININAYRITFFAFYTGCRFSEAAKLKWSEVQEDRIIFRNTKNKTTRSIPIPAPIVTMLSKIPHKYEFVFTKENGIPYSDPPSTFKFVVNKLHLNDNCDPYNKITFHSLRHTAATYMAKYLDVRSLMDIFGWKSITMAARYMHGNEDQKQKAMNSLSIYLEGGSRAKVIQFPTGSGE